MFIFPHVLVLRVIIFNRFGTPVQFCTMYSRWPRSPFQETSLQISCGWSPNYGHRPLHRQLNAFGVAHPIQKLGERCVLMTKNSGNSAFRSTSERRYALRQRVCGDPGLSITTKRRRFIFNRRLSGECLLDNINNIVRLQKVTNCRPREPHE
jgi:hypothetical protein